MQVEHVRFEPITLIKHGIQLVCPKCHSPNNLCRILPTPENGVTYKCISPDCNECFKYNQLTQLSVCSYCSSATKKSILAEADVIAGESRSRDYGHPLQNHQRIADIWNTQLGPKLKVPITAREVALMMIGLKLAREVNTPKRDNLVDAAGYIKCVDMIDEAITNARNGL